MKHTQPTEDSEASKFGFYISMITALLTLITFALAVGTPPLSGPFCTGNCFEYPFADIADRFPRDYYWMYLAILVSLSYFILMVTLYQVIPHPKKLFGMLGVSFALMASLVLITDYFIQLSVVQPSVLAGETDGIALLTQFNPHGIFIVLEEMGFLFMILSFFALFPVFNGSSRLEKSIKWTTIISFALAIVAFTWISMAYGIHREYRFEVAVISITWFELIIVSILLAFYFKQKNH
ncbi:MAG: hypothetical protein RBT57_10690 [Paludibacter sp.]|jgi:hypothetical protein|nr:hypothetical protein [Paludibacter sp.]